ncbi:Isochorismatase hydrolase [Mycena indigotica]|uniref:Isochorismatase hydrolase n=1 Tax=Mycena indigotica TaxID=2126181 RepID=A0A8H6WBE9_9AGAR|nr:Isochorismatase hydrolase [Mycena indigotica]KAF7311747.1 Isochorismatase hydrolase [Mycena indigotica]
MREAACVMTRANAGQQARSRCSLALAAAAAHRQHAPCYHASRCFLSSSPIPWTPPSRGMASYPDSSSDSSSLSSDSTTIAMAALQSRRRVLLCLDAQHAGLSPPPLGNPIPAAAAVLANLKHILATARAATHPPLIVHVRNAGDRGDPDEPAAPGWHLALAPLPGEVVVDKRKNNAFAGTRLADVVQEDAELVVVGLQTDFSLRASAYPVFLSRYFSRTFPLPGALAALVPPPLLMSARSSPYLAFSPFLPSPCSAALARGNSVLLIRGAHGTYDRVEILYGGGLTPAKQVEAEIEGELEEAGVHLLGMEDVPAIFDDR